MSKYNPDINKIFKKTKTNRNKTKFKSKDIPYRLILEKQKDKIKTPEDLIINSKEQKQLFENEFNDIIKNRQLENKQKNKLTKKELTEIKNKFKLKNSSSFEESNIHEELKDDFTSEFIKQENEIKLERENFNTMLDDLLSNGLLD